MTRVPDEPLSSPAPPDWPEEHFAWHDPEVDARQEEYAWPPAEPIINPWLRLLSPIEPSTGPPLAASPGVPEDTALHDTLEAIRAHVASIERVVVAAAAAASAHDQVHPPAPDSTDRPGAHQGEHQPPQTAETASPTTEAPTDAGALQEPQDQPEKPSRGLPTKTAARRLHVRPQTLFAIAREDLAAGRPIPAARTGVGTERLHLRWDPDRLATWWKERRDDV